MSAVGPLFQGLRFARAISLGANCEAAHQLRRLGRHSVHGVFDWLVTPLAAVGAILQDDGARLARGFVATHSGTSVRCSAYDVLYHHEFPRREHSEEVCFDAELIAQCRRKMSHKFATIISACAPSGPVLFIRSGPESDLSWDDTGEPEDGDVRGLERALERRFPDLDFRLLVIDTATHSRFTPPAPGDRLEIVHAPRRRTQGWTLDDGDWDAIAARLRFATPADACVPALDEALYHSGETLVPATPPPTGRQAESQGAVFERAVELWRSGAAHTAAAMLDRLFADGYRADAFLEGYAGLLTGEARFSEVLQRRHDLVREGRATSPRIELLAAHARLALAQDREAVLRAAAQREQGSDWLTPNALMESLEAACRRSRPFSFVRLGDGEARYALAAGLAKGPGLQPGDAAMLGEVVWRNWFGTPMSEVDPRTLSRLARSYRRAVADADVLGVTDAARLASDTGHFGYLAAQEAWVMHSLGVSKGGRRWTSALNHFELDATSPHLSRLLVGRPFVGAVSPHPDLAQRLAIALGIGEHDDYAHPAEGRLPTVEATRLAGPHFPDRFQQVLRELRIPARGAVFVVAAGLLGKIYCHRIKALGGIAIDIGSVADGWMGFDTRPGQMSAVKRLPMPPRSVGRAGKEPAPSRSQIVACVSMAKTGSNALTDALRQAGWPDAVHTHYFGPHSLAYKRRYFDENGIAPEPMMLASRRLMERLSDQPEEIRIVTSIRDPIARLVAQFFAHKFPVTPSADIDLRKAEWDLIDWFRSAFGHERTTEWLDDNLGTTLGVDFRTVPFDPARASCRYESSSARVLLIRQEDLAHGKELELGWLMSRSRLNLRSINTSNGKSYHDAYQKFRAIFRAPTNWIDNFYETDAVRHFYSAEERSAFRTFWSTSS